MKRAIRRHHRRRIIKKFQRIYKNWDYDNWEENGLYTAARGSIRCGCQRCKNPRHGGWGEPLKIQELREFQYDWNSEH